MTARRHLVQANSLEPALRQEEASANAEAAFAAAR
jgi:hypothetical protein